MDYIEYAIEFLDKNNHGISAGRARDQYIALKARIAQLEAAEHNAHQTPESLASSQAVSNASVVSQSDGDTPPAQAQVA